MSYKAKDYYVPSTKAELITLIKKHYWVCGQTAYRLETKTKAQLYAIYYSLRERAL